MCHTGTYVRIVACRTLENDVQYVSISNRIHTRMQDNFEADAADTPRQHSKQRLNTRHVAHSSRALLQLPPLWQDGRLTEIQHSSTVVS